MCVWCQGSGKEPAIMARTAPPAAPGYAMDAKALLDDVERLQEKARAQAAKDGKPVTVHLPGDSHADE
jgi:hypothetical protein